MTLILLAEPHFGATWPFLIHSFNSKKILSEKINFILLPIFIVLLSIFLFIYNKNLLYLFFYLANFYHVTRQSAGISKLYLGNKNINETSFQNYIIYFYGFLFMLIGLLRFQFIQFFEFNLVYLNLIISFSILMIIIFYLFKFKSIINAFLFLTGILIFYPVCFVDAPIHAIIMGVTMHYTQYIFITYKVNFGRYQQKHNKHHTIEDIVEGLNSNYKISNNKKHQTNTYAC